MGIGIKTIIFKEQVVKAKGWGRGCPSLVTIIG
jgi:hypothetical protein